MHLELSFWQPTMEISSSKIILGMGSAIEKWNYFVMSSIIGWAHEWSLNMMTFQFQFDTF